MKKADRQKIFEKCGGRCAYCGRKLGKSWHVDEIEPVLRYTKYRRDEHGRILTNGNGDDLKDRFVTHPERFNIDNQNPACPRCNGWKATFDLETFRQEISEQVKRARAYSCNFRMAEDFGLIKETGILVKFYFETLNQTELGGNQTTKA